MVSAGVVLARQTSPGTVAVVGAAVALARSTARVAVVASLTLVAASSVRVGDARALPAQQVAERVPRPEPVAFAYCTHAQTDKHSRRHRCKKTTFFMYFFIQGTFITFLTFFLYFANVFIFKITFIENTI